MTSETDHLSLVPRTPLEIARLDSGIIQRGLTLIDALNPFEPNTTLGNLEIAGSHQDGVPCVAFSNNGLWFATASWDNSACIWSLSERKVVSQLHGHRGKIRKVCFLGDTNQVITAGEDKVALIWDALKTTLLGEMTDVNIIAISPNGKWALSSDWSFGTQLIDIEDKKKLSSFGWNVTQIQTAGFCPEATSMVTGGRDGSVLIWDLKTKRFHPCEGHNDWVWSVQYNREGTEFLTTSADGTILLHERGSQKGARLFVGHQKSVFCGNFVGHGKYIISSSADGTIRLWDIQSCEPIHSYDVESEVVSMAVRHDNQMILCGCRNGKVLLYKLY